MPKVVINQVEIAYDDVGAGVPIVCLHGSPFNRSMWTPQVEALRTSFRIINFDLRGYGESSMTASPFTFDQYALDALALMDALDIDSAVIMGLSMGGQIALEMWAQSPGRVRALVLADTFAQTDAPERKQGRYDTANQLLAEGMERYSREVLPRMIAPASIAAMPDVAAHVMDMMLTTAPAGAAAALRARAERRDYTPLLEQIAVPCCVIVGRDDDFTPISDAEFMAHRIPGATLTIIDAAGHMPNLEQPAAFNRVVLEFLANSAL